MMKVKKFRAWYDKTFLMYVFVSVIIPEKIFYILIISHQNFREHLCNFLTETLADLPQITDVRKCQLACIVNPKCGWWIYDENKQVCQLHPSGHRDCDMVRGTPLPDYEKCEIDGHINWPS